MKFLICEQLFENGRSVGVKEVACVEAESGETALAHARFDYYDNPGYDVNHFFLDRLGKPSLTCPVEKAN